MAKRWFIRHARDLAPLLTLVFLVLFFSVSARGFWSADTLVSVLRQTPTRAIVGTGLTFVLLCAEIDLSVAMIATFAACLMGVLDDWILKTHPFLLASTSGDQVSMTPIGVFVVLFLPVIAGLSLGLLNGALTVWSRLPSFIISLAMMEIAYGLASYITKSTQYPIPPMLSKIANGGIDLGSAGIQLPFSFLAAGAIMLAAHVVLTYTRFGRYVYMVGGNREAARLAGVRTGVIVAACLAVSGATGALGGLMNAGWLNSAGINQNEKLLLEAVACVVLGGTSLFGGEGGIKNTFVGVLAFTVLSVGLGYVTWVDEFLRRFVMGTVLLAALILNGQLAKLRGR